MTTDENQALQQADTALAIIEQFEAAINDLESFINELPQIYYDEGQPMLQRLKSLYETVDLNVGSGIDTLDYNVKSARSKIERRRLSSEVVRMSEKQGLTNEEIAERIGDISKDTVGKFLREYRKAKPSERARIRRTSIFDTYDQLEKLAAMIYRELARWEGQDGDVHVKYVKELRELIKESHQWMDRVSEREKLEEIAMTVQDVIFEYVPAENQKKVVERFETLGLGKQLTPGN